MARYTFLATSGGSPAGGLAPILTVAHNDETAAPAAPVVFPLTGLLGVYRFDFVPTADTSAIIDLDPGGLAGLPLGERYIFAVLTPDDEALTEIRRNAAFVAAAGGFQNARMVDAVHADGRLTSCRFVEYADAGDAGTDSNRVQEVDVTYTYDGDGNLTGWVGQVVP